MRIIESYASHGLVIEMDGRTYPCPALLEDDEDGIRWLFAPGPEVYAPTWARASAAGAAGILILEGEKDRALGLDFKIRAMTSERFAEQREERSSNYVAPLDRWAQFDHVPNYAEVYQATPGKLIIASSSVLTGFVHGHTHSEFSPMDGLSTVKEILEQAVADNQPGLALTDHGRCSGHPALQAECDAAGIKPVFGIEAYFQDDRFARSDPQNTKEQNHQIRYGYTHLILWAMNEEGLHNLWAMSTESFRDGNYDSKPRMDWDTLRRHSKGVMAASGCLRGPLSVPILNDDEEGARVNLGKLLDIYGDRFYLEVQPNKLAEQEKVNRALVGMAKDFGVPLMATVDSHYPTKTDHEAHQAWIAIQTNSDVNDEGDLFAVNLDLYMQTEADVRRGLAYLGAEAVDEAVRNTLDLVTRTAARIGGKPAAPVYSKKGGVDQDAERLLDLCIENWAKIGFRPNQSDYMARFEREFALLKSKGFCGYYLMVSDYCRFAKNNGILVGPGRGSGAGSLGAYLSDITEVDPLEARLPFERFITEGRTSLPDFDVDFPASKKDVMLGYLRDKYGADYVTQIGTHLRLKSKGIVQNLGRAMMSVLLQDLYDVIDNEEGPIFSAAREGEEIELRINAREAEIRKDLAAVSKIIDEAERGTAGLGMPWDDLWVQFGDELGIYRQKYPKLFDMADKLVGRLKSYGKHAAGVVISTDRPLVDWLPLMGGENGQMVSQFDMGALEAMGLVKFDILTVRTLDTIQVAVDLIREQRQVDVEIYQWTDEYRDPAVWDEISRGNTLGMFQIETHAGTRLATRMKPQNMQELADMTTIVRPGPMRSGLTDTYLKRRAGEEIVTYNDPRLEAITGDSQGCPIYQDHVLELLMKLAGYRSDEADEVRKILGKKKIEKIGPAGQEFVHRAQEWGGMDRDVAQHLWDQLAEFAKYGFNKAHAYTYSMITYWTAWLKIHYPVEFFVAALSTIDKDKIPAFIKEVRRSGYTVLPPDINASGKGFKAEPLAVRYGLDSIKGIGEAAVDYLIAGQFYADFDQFDQYVTAKGTKANAGVQMLLARIGALDSLEPRRAGLVALLEGRSSGEDSRCVWKRDDVRYRPEGVDKPDRVPGESDEEWLVRQEAYDAEWKAARALLPPDFCTFDWTTEEPPVNPRTGKKLALKALPKKCTKACRQYTAPPPVQVGDQPDFSDEAIRAIEHELLGVFLSSTPFDRLDPGDRKRLYGDAERLVAGEPGLYTMAAILMSVRMTKTRASQEDMAFLALDTEVSTVEAVAFPKTWIDIKTGMHTGQLCLVVLEKQDGDRGLVIREYLPVH
jgi:DNA polymerase-3 subunit alpha